MSLHIGSHLCCDLGSTHQQPADFNCFLCWQAEDGDDWSTLAVDAGVGGLGFLAEKGALLAAYFQNVPIVPGETTVDLSGYDAWRSSLSLGERVSIGLRAPVDVDFGGAGGLRNVTKAASKTGVFSRLAKWLGFGKKAAPGAQQGVAALRQAYEAEVRALAAKAAKMKASGRSVEQIAIEIHAERRALGVKYKDLTPPEILEKILERNRINYGDELGPTIEWLRKEGKSWEQIIESASRPGGEDLKGIIKP